MRATRNWIERLERWIAWKLPRGLARWAFYRVVASATQGRWSKTLVPGLTWETAARRWDIGDGPCCPLHSNSTCDESCDCDDWCCPQEPSPHGTHVLQLKGDISWLF